MQNYTDTGNLITLSKLTLIFMEWHNIFPFYGPFSTKVLSRNLFSGGISGGFNNEIQRFLFNMKAWIWRKQNVACRLHFHTKIKIIFFFLGKESAKLYFCIKISDNWEEAVLVTIPMDNGYASLPKIGLLAF